MSNKEEKTTESIGAEVIVIENKGVYSHKFNSPFEYEGNKYNVLNFDFAKLTGRDMIAIEEELSAQNKYIIAPEIDCDFMIRLAGRAANVGSDVLMNLPLKDFNQIRTKVRDFLINSAY